TDIKILHSTLTTIVFNARQYN
ncbi:unnamed protein product, partial [Rhizophagus irregularis]